jgi:TRAP-type C4-dicarboxylate transport system substrate-binding protein
MKKAISIVICVSLLMLSSSLFAAEKPIKVTFTHWEPPSGVGGSTVIEFCKELEQRSGGRVKAEPALAASLGPPTEQFELVASGMAEIGGFIPSYTPGRFPMLSLMVELPQRVKTTKPLSKAFNEVVKKGYFDKEFEKTKLLWVSEVTPIEFMFAKEKVTTLAQMKGAKVRTSGEFWLAAVPKLGAVPVTLPISEVYSALQKGIVDGGLMGYSVMDVFKIREVVKYVMEVGLTYSAFAYAVNKDFYDKLPSDIRGIIDELALKYQVIEASKHDEWGRKGKESFLSLGGGRESYATPEDEWKKIQAILKPVGEDWIKKREASGYPAKKLMDEVRVSLKKQGIESLW